MKLIVGLGNPGDIYKNSRHNIGFSVIKALAKEKKIALKRDRGTFSLSGKAKIGNQNLLLAQPLTFMNLSGAAVGDLVKKYKIDLSDLLVVCDDLDLEFGRLRIKQSGSCGGHRGLRSIMDSLGTQNFARLRLGIGRPVREIDPAEYVLLPFSRKEKEQLKDVLEKAGSCCQSWVTEGIAETMNVYNPSQNYPR